MMVKGKSGNSRQLQNHALTVVEKKCPRCKKDNIVTDSEFGEVICNVCGSVISERIEDTGHEYRNFLDGALIKAEQELAQLLLYTIRVFLQLLILQIKMQQEITFQLL